MTAIRQLAIPVIAADVLHGLTRTPKRLPAKLFYDAEGSAIFDEITRLPEYYVTRTELGILRQRAREILDRSGDGVSVVELGSGSGEKTRVLLDALTARKMRVAYFPVDISASALQGAADGLRRTARHVRVTPIVSDIGGEMSFLERIPAPRLVLYIGSSIGNMNAGEAARFLARVRSRLTPEDSFLLGTDLVKDRRTLLAAYNDAAGVTARFNLNLLARINRELGGHFDLSRFRHEAVWNEHAARIEMYLVSTREQVVAIDALNTEIELMRDERIHTENSHKYTVARARRLLRGAGFDQVKTWCDEKKWFGLHWARPSSRQ